LLTDAALTQGGGVRNGPPQPAPESHVFRMSITDLRGAVMLKPLCGMIRSCRHGHAARTRHLLGENLCAPYFGQCVGLQEGFALRSKHGHGRSASVLPVRRERRLAAERDALGLGIGSAACCAVRGSIRAPASGSGGRHRAGLNHAGCFSGG
jgi:hypothetical protein